MLQKTVCRDDLVVKRDVFLSILRNYLELTGCNNWSPVTETQLCLPTYLPMIFWYPNPKFSFESDFKFQAYYSITSLDGGTAQAHTYNSLHSIAHAHTWQHQWRFHREVFLWRAKLYLKSSVASLCIEIPPQNFTFSNDLWGWPCVNCTK